MSQITLQQWLATNPMEPRLRGTVALTTLERVTLWLSPDQGLLTIGDQQRQILSRLILSVSGMVMSHMNRDSLARTDRTETYPSSRIGRLVLRHWPVLSLTSVSTGELGTFTSPAPLYSLDQGSGGPARLIADTARGGSLIGSAGSVSVSYTTGFVRAEQFVAGVTHQTQSVMLQDEGVADATGARVDDYTVSSDGLYSLPARLSGTVVTVFYSYVPEDIEQVVIDEVGLAYRSRQRIGEASKALPNGGGTVSYLPRRLSEISREALNDYCRVVPS